jgi:hypothetical protein
VRALPDGARHQAVGLEEGPIHGDEHLNDGDRAGHHTERNDSAGSDADGLEGANPDGASFQHHTSEHGQAFIHIARHFRSRSVRLENRELKMRFRVTTGIIGGMLLAGLALAQPKDNKAESDRLFAEGIKAASAKDFKTAREKFAAAYSKFPSPNSLFNLANAELSLDKCGDAVRHFGAYIELPENPRISAKDRQEARVHIAECRPKLCQITMIAPSGTTSAIDGQSITEPTFDVEPGSHEMAMVGPSGSRTKKFTCSAGTTTEVRYEEGAEPTDGGAPASSDGGGTVTDAGINPPPSDDAGTGSSNTRRWVGVGIAAAGAAGVVIGGAMLGVKEGQVSDAIALAKQAPCADMSTMACRDYKSKLDAASTNQTIGIIGLVAGGILLGAGVTIALWPSGPKKTSLAPIAGPGVAGVQLSGQF